MVYTEIQPGTVAEHTAILDAINQGDVKLARNLRATHYDNISESLLAQFARYTQPPS